MTPQPAPSEGPLHSSAISALVLPLSLSASDLRVSATPRQNHPFGFIASLR